MHVTRPKSSKGRTRPTGSYIHSMDESVYQNTFSPHPPPSDKIVRSRAVLQRSSKPSTDVLTEIFENPQDVPVLSLNKYKVLPSIEKRPAGDLPIRNMEDKTSKLSLSDSNLRLRREQLLSSHLRSRATSTSDSEMDYASEVLCDPTAANPLWAIPGHTEGEAGVVAGDTDMVLAIRIPCGQRFKCPFRPTDMLHAIVAAAEAKSGLRFRDVVIETMEVPRRTFKNLSMTLSQCGIFNKSVLCISMEDSTTNSS